MSTQKTGAGKKLVLIKHCWKPWVMSLGGGSPWALAKERQETTAISESGRKPKTEEAHTPKDVGQSSWQGGVKTQGKRHTTNRYPCNKTDIEALQKAHACKQNHNFKSTLKIHWRDLLNAVIPSRTWSSLISACIPCWDTTNQWAWSLQFTHTWNFIHILKSSLRQKLLELIGYVRRFSSWSCKKDGSSHHGDRSVHSQLNEIVQNHTDG